MVVDVIVTHGLVGLDSETPHHVLLVDVVDHLDVIPFAELLAGEGSLGGGKRGSVVVLDKGVTGLDAVSDGQADVALVLLRERGILQALDGLVDVGISLVIDILHSAARLTLGTGDGRLGVEGNARQVGAEDGSVLLVGLDQPHIGERTDGIGLTEDVVEVVFVSFHLGVRQDIVGVGDEGVEEVPHLILVTGVTGPVAEGVVSVVIVEPTGSGTIHHVVLGLDVLDQDVGGETAVLSAPAGAPATHEEEADQAVGGRHGILGVGEDGRTGNAVRRTGLEIILLASGEGEEQYKN